MITCKELTHSWSGNAGHHGEEVEGASGQDKEMPDTVAILQLAPRVEYDAHGVAEASGHEARHAHCGEGSCHGHNGEHDDPAHQEIQHDHELSKSPHINGADDHADECQCPDHAKNGPAKRPAQGGQDKGGIGSCNEQKNGHMVQACKDLFDAWVGDTVIDR